MINNLDIYKTFKCYICQKGIIARFELYSSEKGISFSRNILAKHSL